VRVAWLFAVAGCWTAGEPTPRATPYPEARPVERDPFPLHSKWRGQYRCAQGVTAMYLELTAKPDGALAAIFEFGPTPENPQVPTGAYRLEGKIRAGSQGTFEIALAPLEWIMEPEGYIMVSLSATSSRKQRRLVGRIEHPACGELDVRRAD